MQTQAYEIEIKSLLGNKENAENLKKRMAEKDSKLKLISVNTQLNHYFTGGNIIKFLGIISPLLTETDRFRLKNMTANIKDFSLRTRQKNKEVILVLKISINDETSANGVKRLEFEANVPNITLDALDQKIIDSGFSYEAKWSREREEYAYKNINVTIDKNAGYGYVAEFEKMEHEEEKTHQAKEQLLALMEELGVTELHQDRLQRMFDYYNQHWNEYYGTDKVFEIF